MNAQMPPAAPVGQAAAPITPERVAMLRALARKVLWLSSWTIHNANHLRAKRDVMEIAHGSICRVHLD